MAWIDLPTDYKDAVWDGLKKYVQVDNEDGTVSFRDVTPYIQREKSFFGALDANAMNAGMNELAGELGGVDEKVTQLTNAYISNTFFNNAGAHNSIYRGKNITPAVEDTPPIIVSEAQWAVIKDGTFEDMYIGDYWVWGNHVFRIAAFDYYYGTGDIKCNKHHVTLVLDKPISIYGMNDTHTTEGGYVGSKMYKENLQSAKNLANTFFGEEHVLNHRNLLPNAVTDGYTSGGIWCDSTVELMSERNVYGSSLYGNIKNGTETPSIVTIDKTQFPLFALCPEKIISDQTYWLRDVVSSTHFARISVTGLGGYFSAGDPAGVRPAFSICAL